MKRVLAAAVAAVVTGAVLLGAAPAQAAAPDPVKAVKSKFAPGHGVKISEVMMMWSMGKKSVFIEITGTYGFGRSGVVASDLTLRSVLAKGATTRLRTVGTRAYMSGDELEKSLPEGKTWVRMDDLDAGRTPSSQPVDIFRLPQLKGLLSHASSVQNGVYRGELSRKQANALGGGATFGYRLSTDSAGLPTRLYTVQEPLFGGGGDSTDTRYTAWGHEVSIVDPPDHEVITADALTDAARDKLLEEIQEIPDEALGSAGR
ncbi:hypothetical protein ACBJ59_47760 [Nonomuraea sp. MTCD27]|uniref:hypothetical protein n=1 Tax=Nonomuraea sp. MTCD27 TaxID=1676747 RepID=UPI0035C1B9F7